MRILHTADWHLGRTLHGFSLHEDQQYALEQLKSELAGNYQAIIIAGDIYDRAVPPPEAVELFGSFLNWVRERKLKAVIIPGNHDSPQRLGFADRALEESGVFIRCDYRRLTDPVRLDGPGGHQADIYALPFVETPWVREQLLRDDLVDHTAATAAALEVIRGAFRPGVANLLVAHAFVGEQSLSSESERELIGGSHRLGAELFRNFGYVALGHLHRPQAVPGGPGLIQYSGSLLPYSFSEGDHQKVVMRLALSDGRIEAAPVPLKPKRQMRVLQDTLERLLHEPCYEEARADYVSAVVTDAGYLVNLYARLRERYPLLLAVRQPALEAAGRAHEQTRLRQSSSREELFHAFLDQFGWNDATERSAAITLFDQMCARVETRRREAVP